MASPAIACIGVIAKQNNPLHISLFPPGARSKLEFSFLLSSCLDIFEIRAPSKTADQDFGLLQAVDERLSMYGWLTNTGIKIIIIVDMEGRPAADNRRSVSITGLRDADMKPVGPLRSPRSHGSWVEGEADEMSNLQAFRALHTAYVRLLQNPFYSPDEHTPATANAQQRIGSTQITSKKFINEVKRIGETWVPGITSI
ncbi:MAG: hypothetical protein M1819_001992 [Sarea resinae]|nr:MAG: hypothetical protein M1819_001992 [Sarea resinae]